MSATPTIVIWLAALSHSSKNCLYDILLARQQANIAHSLYILIQLKHITIKQTYQQRVIKYNCINIIMYFICRVVYIQGVHIKSFQCN